MMPKDEQEARGDPMPEERERGPVYGWTEAAFAGDTLRLRELLDAGEDVNQRGNNGSHALLLTVAQGHLLATRFLLDHGARPGICSHQGQTPLAAACLTGFPEIARLLAEAGAPVGIVEAGLLGDVALLQGFLDAGSDIDTEDGWYVTPLVAAAGCGHIACVRFLLEHGADPNREGKTGQTALGLAVAYERTPVIHLLVDHGADVNAVNRCFRSTPLGKAAVSGRFRSVAVLLARGADPSFAGEGAMPPLHRCVFLADSPSISKGGDLLRMAALLLDAGADIEGPNNLGFTPLIVAASTGNADMVRLLLQRGADVRATATDRRTTPLSSVRQPNNDQNTTEAQTLIMEALGTEYAVFDAAERGDLSRLNALLDTGAPADHSLLFQPHLVDGIHFTADDFAESPLLAAAGKGHEAIVRRLLQQGTITQRSKNSALFAAESQRHHAVARLLRQDGATNKSKQPDRTKAEAQ